MKRLSTALLILAAVTMAVPAAATTITIPAGKELLVTLEATVSFHGNYTIPADFFGPGSDPFDGVVAFVAVPLTGDSACAPNDPGDANIIIQRDPIFLGPQPSSAVIPIEIVQLKLVSVGPVDIPFNNGQFVEPWTFEIIPILPQPPPAPKQELRLDRDEENGGDFEVEYSYDHMFRMTREIMPFVEQEYTPPAPDPFGGQGRWGVLAEIPELVAGSPQQANNTLACPSCKTDAFYLGLVNGSPAPFWLTGDHINLLVVIPCTGTVPTDATSWGGLKARYR